MDSMFRALAAVCAAAVVLLSCSKADLETERTLEDVASFIEERPDSALTILDTMDSFSLTTSALKARHSLLLAMARDKNYIDDTTDSIIAPAVSWYRRHGSADEKLLMNYYRGRIAMNAGDYETAMRWFADGSRFSEKARNKVWSGRLCNAKFQVYQHLFDSSSAIDAALRSADYYAAAGELSRYYDAINNVACVYEQLLDTANALHYLGILRDNWDELDESQHSCYYAGMLSISSDKKPVLEQYLCDVNDEQVIYWVIVAKSYFEIGNYEQASRALKMAEKYVGTQGLDYKWVNALVQEATGEYRSAAKSYREFIGANGNNNIDIFESDTKFIEERAASKQKIVAQKYTIIIAFLICVIVLLVAGFITERLIRSYKARKLERQKHSTEMEKQKVKMEKTKEEAAVAMKMKFESDKMYEMALRQVTELEKSIKGSTINKAVRAVFVSYIEVLFEFIMTRYWKKSADTLAGRLDELMEDRESLLIFVRTSFAIAYPHFIKYLKRSRLNDWEIGCCCLYCIGFNGNEVKNYLERPSVKNKVSGIRGRLGVEGTNIDIFLRRKLAELETPTFTLNESKK